MNYIFLGCFVIFCIFAKKFFTQKSKTMDCPKCKISDYVKAGILRGLQRYTCTLYEVRVSVKDVFIDILLPESQM
jgi:hypothetical protein